MCTHIKINSNEVENKWGARTIKFSNNEQNLLDSVSGNDLLDLTSKAEATRKNRLHKNKFFALLTQLLRNLKDYLPEFLLSPRN